MELNEIIRRILFRLKGRVLHFPAKGSQRGSVLMSYITLPFLNTSEKVLNAHTNRWESMEMVRTFVERGYDVDLIDITNTTFIPKKKYNFFVDNYHNMERLAPRLPECVKVFHATTSHWQFNNDTEKRRFDDLLKRRGVRLPVDRVLPPNKAIELCDIATMLGNDATESTYAFAKKEIIRIPISTTHTYPSPESKDIERARKNFVWFGGAGVVHKGLDLTIEAFAQMPEYQLTICGKIEGEKGFLKVYEKELALPNIRVLGFMDPGSPEYKRMCDESIALIYPSCSEGQAGSVVLTMHAGLIPIVSRESGVDVEDFGVILRENTIAEIKKTVAEIAALPSETLKTRAVAAWKYANTHHTRDTFARSFLQFVDRLETLIRGR